MTDHTHDLDQAERIRRLQARRAASGNMSRPAADASTGPSGQPSSRTTVRARTTARPGASKARRRHPAAATRWLLGGLSIASFFTVAGTVAAANVSAVATQAPAPTAATTAGTSAQATAPSSATPGATNTKATPAPAPHTTTRGS